MNTRSWLFGALISLLAGTDARADYVDTYRLAIRAYEAGNWQAAADLMRRARTERSSETGRVLLGGNIPRDYLPSYYLGDALMRLSDCSGALEAFVRAEQTAAANNRAWVARIAAARKQCGAFQRAGAEKELTQAVNQAEPVLQQARAARDNLQGLRTENYGAQALQTLGGDVNEAAAALAEAESRLAQARQSVDPQAGRDAQRLAQAALTQFQALDARLRTEMQRLQRDADARTAAATATAEAAARDAKAKEDARIAQEQRSQLLSEGQAGMRRAQEAMNAYDNAAAQRPASPAVLEARNAMTAAGQILGRGIAAGDADLRNATTLVARARDSFVREREAILTTDTTEGRRLVGQLLAGAAESLQTIENMSGPTARLRLTPSEIAEVEKHRRELTRLRSAVAGAAGADPRTLADTRTSAEAVSTRLADLAKAVGQRAALDRGIPPGLVDAARSFFTGQYTQARERLDALMLPSAAPDEMRFQVHLLRAAALYGSWATGGEQDATLRRAAAEAIAQCKQILPSKEPDASAFSPRFIAFYRNPS